MVLLVITDINKASAVPYSTSSSFALEIPDGYSVPACCLHCCFRGRKQKQTLTRAVRQPDSELFWGIVLQSGSWRTVELEYRWCQFWSKMMKSEVEQSPTLATAGYGWHGSQWVKWVCKLKKKKKGHSYKPSASQQSACISEEHCTIITTPDLFYGHCIIYSCYLSGKTPVEK